MSGADDDAAVRAAKALLVEAWGRGFRAGLVVGMVLLALVWAVWEVWSWDDSGALKAPGEVPGVISVHTLHPNLCAQCVHSGR